MTGGGKPGRLQLLSPKAHYFLNSTFANMPRQRTKQGSPTLEMNEADAAVLGLADGADVIAECERGALRACLRVTPNIAPGSVAIEGKWWWTEPIDGAAVANRLAEGAWTPMGQPAYNDVHVTVRCAGT